MFDNIFKSAIYSKGLEKRDIGFLIRSSNTGYLTDEQIFVFSRFLNSYRGNIGFTKYIGDLVINAKLFDIAVVYQIKHKTSNKLLCTVDVNFDKCSLYIYFDCMKKSIEVMEDLNTYKNENKNDDVRMKFLDEILSRYFTDLIYAIYVDIGRDYYDKHNRKD